MAETKQIKTALISVFHKDGLDELLGQTECWGVKILVYRRYSEIYRITWLWMSNCGECHHISVYSRGQKDSSSQNIRRHLGSSRQRRRQWRKWRKRDPSIDLVIVDLYPFEQTVASGASADEIKRLISAVSRWFAQVLKLQGCGHRAQQGWEYGVLLDIPEPKGYSDWYRGP